MSADFQRGDPSHRRVFEDWLLECGVSLNTFRPLRIDGGGGDGGYSGGDGSGYGDGGYGGYGGGGFVHIQIHGDEFMREGLTIVSLPSGGYYPYTEVGWLKRLNGDEWEMHGARIIRKYGRGQALTALAANGPAADTELLPPSIKPLPVHRLHMGRPEACNEKVWAAHCPRPVGVNFDE